MYVRACVCAFRAQAEKLSPTAKLTAVRSAIRPTASSITPLSPQRDMLPPLTGPGSGLVPLLPAEGAAAAAAATAAAGGGSPGRQIHRLVLTYKLVVEVAGSYTLSLPAVNRRVYDAEMEAQMLFLFDAQGRAVHVHDIYPKIVKLKKGTYEAKVLMRHDRCQGRAAPCSVRPLLHNGVRLTHSPLRVMSVHYSCACVKFHRFLACFLPQRGPPREGQGDAPGG